MRWPSAECRRPRRPLRRRARALSGVLPGRSRRRGCNRPRRLLPPWPPRRRTDRVSAGSASRRFALPAYEPRRSDPAGASERRKCEVRPVRGLRYEQSHVVPTGGLQVSLGIGRSAAGIGRRGYVRGHLPRPDRLRRRHRPDAAHPVPNRDATRLGHPARPPGSGTPWPAASRRRSGCPRVAPSSPEEQCLSHVPGIRDAVATEVGDRPRQAQHSIEPAALLLGAAALVSAPVVGGAGSSAP